MPLNRCANGRGWRWGSAGKCYTGKDAKKMAIKQGLAIGHGTLEKSNDDLVGVDIPITIHKNDPDKQLVYGWANVSMSADNELVVDSHGDTISIDELEQAAYEFNLHYRKTGEMHAGDAKGELIESFVVTDEKLKALGLPNDSLQRGWWVGFYVEDKELFEKVKRGTYKSFSIQGSAKRLK